MVLLRPHARNFFSLFSKRIPAGRNSASLLAGRFEKMKESRERMCNSTISMGEGGKKPSFFRFSMNNDYNIQMIVADFVDKHPTIISDL